MPPRKQRSSLPPKTSRKKKSRVPTYETFDEALDGGVEQEEKGERYRVGDKAKRHYETACELYERAVALDGSRFEGHYNLARTLYHLSTAFLLPPSLVVPLERSIATYRLANGLTTDPQLLVDAGYNLAVALVALADVKDDFGESGAQERGEAAKILAEVAERQEQLLRDAASGQEVEAVMELGDEGDEAADEDDDSDDDGDDEDGNAAAANGRAWEETVSTPSTLLDTYLQLLPLLPSPALPDLDPATLIDQIQALGPLCTQIGAPRDIEIITAVAAWRIVRIEDRADGWEDEGRQLVMELDMTKRSQTDSTPIEEKVELACVLSDAQTALALATRRVLLARGSPAAAEVQEVWTLLSAATQNSTAALSLLTAAQSAFPSATVSTSAAATTAPILLALARLSLARSLLAKAPFSSPAAVKNGPQLLANALTYARRAAEATSTGLQTVLPPYPALATYTASAQWTDGGWESESAGREAVLLSLRVVFLQGQEEEAMRILVKSRPRLGRRGGEGWLRAWVDELADDEGGFGPDEQAFWTNVGSSLAG